MAKNNFNFRVKAGLETKDFKRGTNQLRSMMASLRSSFLSLAGGIGLGLGFEKLISSVRDTVTQLSVAKATLKNVSEITKTYSTEMGVATIKMDNYGENLEFVRDLSNKYGQDLIALTESYAKFTAAAKGSTISLADQEKIFHALTRAAATYHLSADTTKEMMNAVIQMMSKGKITAEELRRQLGNTLPGAFNIFAEAAGVTTAKLEEMMRNGELLASDILPKVADKLNEITANANFDSLQTSLNAFKNAWTELVERSGAEEMFKKLVDLGTNALKHLTENFNVYGTSIKYMLLGLIPANLFAKGLTNSIQYFKNFRANTIAEIDAVNGRMKVLQDSINNLTGGFNPAGADGFSMANLINTDEDAIKNMIEYNNLLERRGKLEKEIGKTTLSTYTRTAGDVKTNTRALNDHLYQLQLTNAQIQNGGRAWVGWGKAFKIAGKGIVGTLKNIGRAIKSFLGPIGLIMVAIEGVLAIGGAIVGKLKEEKAERERIAAIVGDSDKRIGESMAPTNEEIERITKTKDAFLELYRAGNDANAKHKFKELQELIPSLKNITYEDLKKKADGINLLTDAVANYIEAIKTAAEFASMEKEIEKLDGEINTLTQEKNDIIKSGKPLTRKVQGTRAGGDYGSEYTVKTDVGQRYDTVNATLDKAIQRRAELQQKMRELKVVEQKTFFTPEPEIEETPIEKVYKADKEALKKLKNQYKEGAISQEEYFNKLNQLARNSYEDAAATGALSLEKITKKLNSGKTLTALEKWYYELSQRASTAIATEALDKIIKELEEEFDEMMKQLDKEIKFWGKVQDGEFKPKSVGNRSEKFDYKKTGYDIAAEQFDIYSDRVANAEEAIENFKEAMEDTFGEAGNGAASKMLREMNVELERLKGSAKSWEEVMALEEMKQDLKDIQYEIENINWALGDAAMSMTFGFVSSIDSVVSAFQRLNDVAEDFDASGWERFMAAWGVFESIMNGVISTMNTINTIIQLSNSLADIEAQKRALNNSMLIQENALKGTNVAVTTAAAGASTAAAAATTTEAAATAGNIAAKSGEAVASATASGAKMPFPLNLLAIAAGVAAVIAALAAVSKFESGGIVGGNSTRGDKNLARVNSGEMILNKAQQGTLWSMLNGKGGMSGNVNFKIRGADLIGVINNENSRRRG